MPIGAAAGGVTAALISSLLKDPLIVPPAPYLYQETHTLQEHIHWPSLCLGMLVGLILGQSARASTTSAPVSCCEVALPDWSSGNLLGCEEPAWWMSSEEILAELRLLRQDVADLATRVVTLEARGELSARSQSLTGL